MLQQIFQIILYEEFWIKLQQKRSTIGTSRPLEFYLETMMKMLNYPDEMINDDILYCIERSVVHAIFHCYDCGYEEIEIDKLFEKLVEMCVRKRMWQVAVTMVRSQKAEITGTKELLCRTIIEAGLEKQVLRECLSVWEEIDSYNLHRCLKLLYDFQDTKSVGGKTIICKVLNECMEFIQSIEGQEYFKNNQELEVMYMELCSVFILENDVQ